MRKMAVWGRYPTLTSPHSGGNHAAIPARRWRSGKSATPILAFLALLLAGCSLTNITDLERAHAKVIEALGKDPATVCVTASYGPAQIVGGRTNITNGDVKCSTTGLEVKSQATQVGVPMTITPQLSIGAPTLIQPAPVQVAPPQQIAPPVAPPAPAPPAPRSQLPAEPDAPRASPDAALARHLLRDHGR